MLTREQLIRNLEPPRGRVDVILDTDTFNEADDQYALSYLLLSGEKLNTVGICAAPFLNANSTSPADGMEKSYREILKLLGLLHREDLIPAVMRGACDYLPDEKTPVVTDASEFMVREARKHSPENPLYIVSIAAATFGLVAGSLMGGPTAKRLIEKHDLRPAPVTAGGTTPSAALATDVASEDERFISDSPRFVKGFMLLLLAVGIGNQVSVWLTALTGLTFPAYIGAMLIAVVVRNVMDGVHVSYPAEEIDTMGNMFLSIFLAMALAGLKLWELIDLAMPMVICLVLQCVVMFLFSYFVVFNVMGRNYDAAVMTAGFIGFAMGATSNAMANMQVVTKKYGPSPVAYFAIPMVGGMFIDFFNAVLIAANIGWWT